MSCQTWLWLVTDGLSNLTKGPNLSTKVKGKTIELFHPRRHEWNDHFAFSGPEIVGVTPTGQATVQLLNMNAPRRIAIRRRMLTRGETLKTSIRHA